MASRRAADALFESLESRRLLAAEMTGAGELLVVGTQDDDVIVVEAGEAPGTVRLYGVYDVEDATLFEGVDSIRVAALRGDDEITLSGDLRDTDGNAMTTRAFAGAGDDKVFGSANDDILVGGLGTDVIRGNAGVDVIAAGGGSDWVFGGEGNDLLIGNWGHDHLWGDEGNDAIYGGAGHDTLFGGDGDDFMAGQLGFDSVYGGLGADVVRGGGHADVLRGGDGDDLVVGGWGPDDLYGGAGTDQLFGLGSTDRFRGPMDEREDFTSGDLFYNAFVSDPDIAALPDSFWNAVDELETDGEVPEEAWVIVDGAQTLSAECGPSMQQAAEAIQGMSDLEMQLVGEQLEPLIAQFGEQFGDGFDANSMDEILGLFDQIVDAFPDDVAEPLDNMVDCLGEHQDLIVEMSEASNTLQQEHPDSHLFDEFWSAYFATFSGQ